jgi:uncharacterized coiled-coil DUF342 family protein
VKQKSFKVRAEINTSSASEKNVHERIVTIAEKSQGLHEKMISKIEESKKIKTEADGLHQSFLEARKKVKSVEDEMTVVSIQIREFKGAAREESKKERTVSENAIREQLQNVAREKLQKGEKLTLEEFKMLAGEDDDAED